MNKFTIILVFTAIALFSTASYSSEKTVTEAELKESITLTKILGAQIFLLILSESCSNIPHSCGAITALAVPLMASKSEKISTAGWAAIIGLEALSIYNLSVDEVKKTKDDLVINNMISLNLIAGISYYFLDEFDSDTSLSLQPTKHGGAQLVFNYKF